MRDYLKVQQLFARIATKDMAARDKAEQVRPQYYSAMLERMAMDAVKSAAPGQCDKALIQCLLEQIGAIGDPCTQLSIQGKVAWQPEDPGFRVRRYGDHLIVTEAAKDHRFAPGDVITKVQNNPIPEYYKQVWRTLRTTIQENEDWLIALQFSSTVHVQREGEERIPLLRFSFDQPVIQMEAAVREDVCVLRLDSLADEEKIRGLLSAHAQNIRQGKGVVVDLRRCTSCCGNCDALLPLLTNEATYQSALMPRKNVYMLYSEGNKRLYHMELEALLPAAQSEQERRVLEDLLEEIDGKSGWVLERMEDEEDLEVQPLPCKRLIVLSDRETGPDAELFIEAVRRLSRGIISGRNTMGALDYVHPQVKALDDSLTLIYSCGMREEAYHGNRINGIGLVPDVHIPWTPAFLTGDPDIEAALRLISE